MARPIAHARGDYPHTLAITTRWMDNDAYGHVNNVVHYSYFDTVVNDWLIRQGLLDVEKGPVIGLVRGDRLPLLRGAHLPGDGHRGIARRRTWASSSVRYEIALFGEGRDRAAAQGHFVHVYVSRETRRPMPLPEPWRRALQALGPAITP